jgi:hypothetical protein
VRLRYCLKVTKADAPPQLASFITWLKVVIETTNDTRTRLGDYLGPGGEQRIDRDLSGGYLPAWQYVVSTYVGPVEVITNRPLAKKVLDEGRQLYKAATSVAVPYVPAEREHESYSRVVAPVLAGFSLPAIVSLATGTTPGQPYRDISVACFITATGFFLASFQLTIGGVYRRLYGWGTFRAGLTFAGILLLVTALMVLAAAVSHYWWMDLALAALALGGLTQGLALGWLKLRSAKGKGPARTALDGRPNP